MATGSANYAYNGDEMMKSETTGTTVTYSYDGDGRRVQKSSGTIYWYGTDGQVLDETNLSGSLTNEYVFFGGKRIARRDSSGNVFYYFADHLGTTSQIVEAGQTSACYNADFYPFGGEVSPFVNSCPQNYKFTGKERDSESGLDDFGARYLTSSFGRFVNPDPSNALLIRLINPQRWNKYTYTINSPTAYVDPDGKDAAAVNFVSEVPVGGHEGILVVHADGTATYGRFGPNPPNQAAGPGKVTVTTLKNRVQFGPDRLPTDASYKQLADEVAALEGVSPITVGFNYFQTSEADSIILDQWLQSWEQRQAPNYCVTSQNCAATTIAGLIVGNAINTQKLGWGALIPNRLFMLLSSLANQNWTWQGKQLKPHSTYCLKRPDGSCTQ